MGNRNFMALVQARWQAGASISIGLDVTPPTLPPEYAGRPDPLNSVVEYHRAVIIATREVAAAFKPQIAGYEAMGPGGMACLLQAIQSAREIAPEVPVILDAKRGDIGTTNELYAEAVFDQLDADAVTVAPYMGPETMAPFLDRVDKGVIILCRTSNPGAGRYQDLLVDGVPLYQVVAKDIAESWNRNGNCGLVVGATYPAELAEVRKLVGELPVLVPGIGAQGGDVAATVRAGESAPGRGLLLHASRSVLNAWKNDGSVPAAVAAGAEALRLHNEIAAAR